MHMNMKKWLSLLLAALMVLSLGTAVAEENDIPVVNFIQPREVGSITVTNAVDSVTYTAYKIFDLNIDSTGENFAYTLPKDSYWYTPICNSGYFTLTLVKDSNGKEMYVVEPKESYTDAAAATLAASLKKYLDENPTNTPTGKTFISADGSALLAAPLDLGYYFVTSSMGSLCALDTNYSDVTITEKNPEPTVEKKVQEDSNGFWDDENTAQIGDTVEFKTTIKAYKGAVGYVLHDTMSEGLTLNQDSIKVTVSETELTKNTNYTVTFENTDNCDFEITFKQTYLDTITGTANAATEIVVTYSAILNDKAAISTDANTNKTKLDYGVDSNYSTEWDETKTYTYKFDLVKTDKGNGILNGAEFKLYGSKTGNDEIALVKEDDGSYRIATNEEKAANDFTSAFIEAGNVTIKGLDADTTYWLEETKAPDGFNMLAARVEVKMEQVNRTATINQDKVYVNGGVQVVNQTGSELPSTGGMGTTILYAVGGVLVLAAFVLIVTKRRASEN